MKEQFLIELVCKTLVGKIRSAHYEFAKGKTYRVPTDSLINEVQECFMVRRRYGSRQVCTALRAKGIPIGRHRTSQLLKRQGLHAIQPKSFVPKTTNSRHLLGYATNVLKASDFPSTSKEVYARDITYFPLVNGEWLYLNRWMDLFTREIVGWKIEEQVEV